MPSGRRSASGGVPLWTGRTGAFVPREAARLEEMRLAAVEQCLAVELDLGRHGAIVAELASLVDEHPSVRSCGPG
ncbi:hypothetical protein K8Z49_10860 [Actinomadura madurae]